MRRKLIRTVLTFVITLAMISGLMTCLGVNAETQTSFTEETVGNTYYVDNSDPDANDNNPGTEELPWVNCPGMVGWSGTIVLQPGDTVYFNNSGTWNATTGTHFLTATGGVTYDGRTWGPGSETRATFKAMAILRTLVTIMNDDPENNTVIKGFELDSNNFETTGLGINWPHAQRSLAGATKRIEDVIVHDVARASDPAESEYGIIVSSGYSASSVRTVRNIEVINCTAYNISRGGINIYSARDNPEATIENVLVKGCNVHHYGTDPTYTGSGLPIKNHVINCIVEDNFVHDAVNGNGMGVSTDEVDGFEGPENLIIRNNLIYNVPRYGYSIGVHGDTSLELTGNRFIGCKCGIRLTTATTGTLSLRINGNITAQNHDREVQLTPITANVALFEFSENIMVSTNTNSYPFEDYNNIVTSHSGNVYYRFGGGTLATVNDAAYTAGNIDEWEPDANPVIDDTTAPSVPANLEGSSFSNTVINLTWTASTDDIAVAGYRIYRDGTLIGTSGTPSYSDTGLSAGMEYEYTVEAYDLAGNVSLASNVVSVSTNSTPIPTILNEDFDDGTADNWNTTAGTWSADGGLYRQTAAAGRGEAYYANGTSWSNYIYSADVKAPSSSAKKAGIAFRINSGMTDYYVLRFIGTTQLQFAKYTADVFADLQTYSCSVTAGMLYNLKVEANGNNFTFYLNDSLIGTNTNSSFTSGSVGLYTIDQTCNFDNVLVNAQVEPLIDEDFGDGTADSWNTAGGGTWGVNGGLYKQTAASGRGEAYCTEGSSWSDYAYSADVKAPSSGNKSGIAFRINSGMTNYYVLRFVGTTQLQFAKYTADVFTGLQTYSCSVTSGTMCNLKVEAEGNSFTFYLNDSLIGTVTNSSFASGSVGLYTFDQACDFDNVLAVEM